MRCSIDRPFSAALARRLFLQARLRRCARPAPLPPPRAQSRAPPARPADGRCRSAVSSITVRGPPRPPRSRSRSPPRRASWRNAPRRGRAACAYRRCRRPSARPSARSFTRFSRSCRVKFAIGFAPLLHITSARRRKRGMAGVAQDCAVGARPRGRGRSGWHAAPLHIPVPPASIAPCPAPFSISGSILPRPIPTRRRCGSAPLAEAADVRVRFRPFLLGPIFKAQGWTTSPFNLYPAKGRHMWRDLERLCADLGAAVPAARIRSRRTACWRRA